MAHEDSVNRSSALSPEQMAMVNSATQAAVQEAIKSVFASLTPVLQDMALTPEKIRAANTPLPDPKKAALELRELRESLKSKEDEAQIARITKARREACPHLDKNGRSSVCLVHNQPDHAPRGICVTCHDWIHPREWVIDAPDPITGKQNAHIREAHPHYKIVLQLESQS